MSDLNKLRDENAANKEIIAEDIGIGLNVPISSIGRGSFCTSVLLASFPIGIQ